jgi:16S rRNA (cytosine1402-N4)-methyltransferase
MVREVIDYLDCSPGKRYVDGTLGGGGHAQAILRAVGPDGHLIGVDRDPVAVAGARRTLREFQSNISLFHSNFTQIPEILSRLHITGVDGIFLDLGLSLYQLEESGRGFSFMRDEPLDMRMNPEEGETAEVVVNRLSTDRLAGLIARFGEERWAGRIAREIVRERRRKPIQSSLHLAEIVKRAIPARHRPRRLHPATRTFQALRIEVNRELESLDFFLRGAAEALNTGGRLCILSFHSLEDRLVKQHFKDLAQPCKCPPDLPSCVCLRRPQLSILTKKPVRPSPAEVTENPMARSAKLRAAERL